MFIFSNEKKIRKIRPTFDTEKWLLESELCYIWHLIPNWVKYPEHFYGCFHRPLTLHIRSWGQLFKWGHSNLSWTKNLWNRILWINFKYLGVNLGPSSDFTKFLSGLLTSVHLKRLLTSKSSNILSVIWLNPGFVKISSNILLLFYLLKFIS